MRAKYGEKLCPVCWLVRELAREHKAGEHDPEKPNASCVACMRPLRAVKWRKEPRRLIEAAEPYAGHGELRQELLRASESLIRSVPAVDRVETRHIERLARIGAHADCDHPATKAARAKCRADRVRRV
jgi:hypothetical protein